jgi:hypothetical protein
VVLLCTPVYSCVLLCTAACMPYWLRHRCHAACPSPFLALALMPACPPTCGCQTLAHLPLPTCPACPVLPCPADGTGAPAPGAGCCTHRCGGARGCAAGGAPGLAVAVPPALLGLQVCHSASRAASTRASQRVSQPAQLLRMLQMMQLCRRASPSRTLAALRCALCPASCCHLHPSPAPCPQAAGGRGGAVLSRPGGC